MTGPSSAGRTAREILDDLASGYIEYGQQIRSRDPINWPGYGQRLTDARNASGMSESVICALATIAGQRAVILVFDFRFLGGSVGEATGRKITAAVQLAIQENVPFVSVTSSGGARMQEGMASLTQMQHIAAVLARARAAGIPHIAVTRHPTTGAAWASLAASADLIIAEEGAMVSFAGSRVRAEPHGMGFGSEDRHAQGFVDYVLSSQNVRLLLERAVIMLGPRTRGFRAAPLPLPTGKVPIELRRSAWDTVRAARDPQRPRAIAYLTRYFSDLLPINGDRAGGRDPGMLCGFGRRGDITVAYVAQTGTPNTAAGFRTASRLLRMAARLQLPVITLIDTPGPANGSDAERAGVGTAIAELLQDIATLKVPLTSLLVGEGGSGGAIAIAAPANLWVTPLSFFSVIAPEAAAMILKQPISAVERIAEDLRLKPEDLVKLGIARGIVRGVV